VYSQGHLIENLLQNAAKNIKGRALTDAEDDTDSCKSSEESDAWDSD
jgi:hypothetical protein